MIVEGMRAALGFLPRAWAWPWFLGWIVAAAVVGLLVIHFGNAPSWLSLALTLGMLVYLPLFQGPLYAMALGEAGAAPALAGGWVRYPRLVAVGALTLIFLAVPALLIFVVGLGAAYGMTYAAPGFDPADVATWTASGLVLTGSAAVLTLGMLAMAWLAARVALGPAETVVQGRILMLSTWPLTRGRGWKIMVARLTLTLPILIAVGGIGEASRRAFPGREAFQVVSLISTLLVVSLRMPLNVGLLAYFHSVRAPSPAVTPR